MPGVRVKGKACRLISKLVNQKSLSLINGPPKVNPPSLRWKGARRQPSIDTRLLPAKSLSGQVPSPGVGGFWKNPRLYSAEEAAKLRPRKYMCASPCIAFEPDLVTTFIT